MSAVTQLHDKVSILTDIVKIDERITWHAPDASGYEPYNEYLIDGGDRVLLVDGGIGLHASSIVATLREVLQGRELFLYATRIELECIGNFGRLLDAFPQARLVTANVVPLASLFHVDGFKSTTAPVHHMAMGSNLSEFGFPDINILQAPVRMLGTSWLWDAGSRTLFTTDMFCTDMLREPGDHIIRTHTQDMPDRAMIRATLLTKFDWLAVADTQILEHDWDDVFARVNPLAIAPIHGRIQAGAGVVHQAIGNHRQALFDRNPFSAS